MDGSVVFARWRQCAPHLIHDSLGPSEPTTQTASQSIQPFLQGSTTVTDRQLDPKTDHATRSVTIGCIYVSNTAIRPNNTSCMISHNNNNKTKPTKRHLPLLVSCSSIIRLLWSDGVQVDVLWSRHAGWTQSIHTATATWRQNTASQPTSVDKCMPSVI